MRVDLPAFGAPMRATKPQRVWPPGAAVHAAPFWPVLTDAFARDERRRRRLLGEALRKAFRLGPRIARHFDGNREFRRVIGAGSRGLAIEGRRKATRLRPFLQQRLRIAQRVVWRAHSRAESGGDDGFGRAIARVEENGADDRFANIAQNGRVGAAGLLFAVA